VTRPLGAGFWSLQSAQLRRGEPQSPDGQATSDARGLTRTNVGRRAGGTPTDFRSGALERSAGPGTGALMGPPYEQKSVASAWWIGPARNKCRSHRQAPRPTFVLRAKRSGEERRCDRPTFVHRDPEKRPRPRLLHIDSASFARMSVALCVWADRHLFRCGSLAHLGRSRDRTAQS
jgi:hypothetical protein